MSVTFPPGGVPDRITAGGAKKALYGDKSRPPPAAPFDPAGVPAELKALPQWVAWRFAWKPGRGKWDKPPLDANRGGSVSAKSNDPATWAAFGAAATLAAGGGLGAGFVLAAGGGLVGADLDNCRDPETGAVTPAAARIAAALGTYCEVSPSGLGLKLIGRGALPPGARNKVRLPGGGELELYDRGRYFTVTGMVVPGSPASLAECSAAIDAVVAEFPPRSAASPPPPGTPADAAPNAGECDGRLGRMFASKCGAAIRRLYGGDDSAHGGDRSAADLALCNHLAFWFGPDPADIDARFRESGRMRPKWDEPHSAAGTTCGNMTVAKSLRGRTEFFGVWPAAAGTAAPRDWPEPTPFGADADARLDLPELFEVASATPAPIRSRHPADRHAALPI